jgi:DNA-binding transcriptional LysR family regulator
MDLWQLNVFCKVIELGGFSKAAREIHLSQPTVSNHIKELESHFGCRLVDRIDRNAIPTRAGEILYRYARRMIQLRDQTETAMAEYQGNLSGILTIGGSTIPGSFILPACIGHFHRQYPEVKISLIISDTDTIIEKIRDGTVELGIVGAAAQSRHIQQQILIKDDMRLIVPAMSRLAKHGQIPFAAILTEPFIIREKGSGTLKSIQNSLNQQGLKSDQLNIVAELGSTTAVIQGIKTGLGISILSPIAVKDELRSGLLHALTLEDIDLRRNFYLSTRRGRSASPLAGIFIDFVFNTIGTPNTEGTETSTPTNTK